MEVVDTILRVQVGFTGGIAFFVERLVTVLTGVNVLNNNVERVSKQ